MEKTVIFTAESIDRQIELLKAKYPSLDVVRSDTLTVQLHGTLPVHRSHSGFVVNKQYTIDIYIPLNSEKLPYVIDSGNCVSPDYHHRYSNGMLCLETDASIRIRFIDGFDLVTWIFEYVEVYYFSYEYYTRYGEFPFGEREHGFIGCLQAFQDLLSTADLVTTYKLMKHIATYPYRGHHNCPCGSKKHLRTCHGAAIMKFYQDNRLMDILRQEIIYIDRELKLFREQRKNFETAK